MLEHKYVSFFYILDIVEIKNVLAEKAEEKNRKLSLAICKALLDEKW